MSSRHWGAGGAKITSGLAADSAAAAVDLGRPGLRALRRHRSHEYPRALFREPGENEPVLPVVVDNVVDYSTVDRALLRSHTVRNFEPGEVSIDFLVHDDGGGQPGLATPIPATSSG